MNGELTKLESAVIELLLAGDHPVLAALREQLAYSAVRERTKSDAGFFTYFKLDKGARAAATNRKVIRLADVKARIEGLQHGAGFVLFVTNGFLDMLEGFSYEEPWPEAEEEFELGYESGEARDESSLQL